MIAVSDVSAVFILSHSTTNHLIFFMFICFKKKRSVWTVKKKRTPLISYLLSRHDGRSFLLSSRTTFAWFSVLNSSFHCIIASMFTVLK